MLDNGWKCLNELRRVDANYSGMRYSVEYAKEADIFSNRYCETFGEIPSVGVCEGIKLYLDVDKGIQYRACEINRKSRGYKTMFDTQFGVFHNDNRGEFGGSLISPSGVCVHGNFTEVVNHKQKVYAVDSMNHLGLSHFRLLEFTDTKRYREIYSTVDDLKEYFNRECLRYGAFFDTGDALYFVISGFVMDKREEDFGHTKLLKVQNSRVEDIFAGDEEFYWINSLVVFENKAYVSMDKMVASIDLATGGLEYYTNLSELAERDLLIIQKKQQRKKG